MKPVPLIILLWLLSTGADCEENYEQLFGTVNMDELQMNSYDRDRSAEAVVLYDIGNNYFSQENNEFRIVFERITRIKIFNRAGFDYAEIEIPFNSSSQENENVFDIEGFTYNLDNGIPVKSKFHPANVFEEKISDYWRVKKFALPDVKEGSVIEFRYKISSPFSLNIRDWDFQCGIPEVYSEYTTRMIPDYEFTYLLHGAPKFDVFRKYQDNQTNFNIYTFGMKDIPALRYENHITSVNDYIIRVNFQLAAFHNPNGVKREIKWSSLIQDMLKTKGFGLYEKSLSHYSKNVLKGLTRSSMTDPEKIEAIFRYVTNNFTWDGVEEKLTYKTRRNFLKEKTGNSAELNLFLTSLLRAAGFETYPVLLSTRSHGKIPADEPFLQFLNYVIVLVRLPDQDLLLDATEPYSPFGVLPSRCLNDKGIIVKKSGVDWITLADDGLSEISDSVTIRFANSLSAVETDHVMRVTGHDALRLRRNYANDPGSLEEEFLIDGMELKRPFGMNQEKTYENPLSISFSTTSDADRIGDKLLVFPFAGITMKDNPLKLSFNTNTPAVNLVYKWSRQFKAEIEIPPGYTCMFQNQDLIIENEQVDILYKMAFQGKIIEVTGYYAFKKPIYYKDEYYDIKDYFNNIINTFNEPIVLVKE
jgi:transglutaminase-like putative cysteine protease